MKDKFIDNLTIFIVIPAVCTIVYRLATVKDILPVWILNIFYAIIIVLWITLVFCIFGSNKKTVGKAISIKKDDYLIVNSDYSIPPANYELVEEWIECHKIYNSGTQRLKKLTE